MKTITLLSITALLLISCATFPACNEPYDQSAMLVKIANEHSVCLDNIGNSLILANGAAISVAKLYTARQALLAVNLWIAALENPVIDTLFSSMVYSKIGSFPELILITDVFRVGFTSGQVIDEPSRKILIGYLSERVKPMLEARIKAAK